jgi:2-polyprenyl-3-methyl-5-hydroxy-6-metoxy-1,4-benzoquinol methylase
MTQDSSQELFQNYERHYKASGAERWEVPINDVTEFHLDRLPRWIDRIQKSAKILDAGCATGYLLSLLHKTGYQNLTGVDLSEQLSEIARYRLPESVEIIVSDIQTFLKNTADETYDVIFFHHVLEHIPREETISLLNMFRRCLKPGGHLSIKVPNASYILSGNHLYCDFTHVVHFNERSMLQVMEAAGFSTENINFILHPPLLFWSWHHPIRALFRLLNRLRWNIHRTAHRLLCILIEQHPVPKAFEAELETLAQR